MMRIPFALAAGVLCSVVAAQHGTAWRDSLNAYWAKIDAEFLDPEHSPLPTEARPHFTGVERFAPDSLYVVEATFKPKPGKMFGMRTTTGRLPTYQAVGTLRFAIQGVKEQLTVYRNVELSKKPEYTNYLFIPFTDLTNGETTYGGGRYVELTGPLGKHVELDLNRAYNPYCAYGGKYSCPIPPKENHLDLRVLAGAKAFEH